MLLLASRAMNGCGSSAGYGSLRRRWSGSSRGSRTRSAPCQASGGSRPSTCTSRSPFSGTGPWASSTRSSARCGRRLPGPFRHGSRCAVTTRRGASECSRSTTRRAGLPLSPRISRAVSRSSLVYERERRRWLPHVTVLRFRRRPGLRPALPELAPFVPSDAAAYLSRLRPGGAQYEVLEAVPVGGR